MYICDVQEGATTTLNIDVTSTDDTDATSWIKFTTLPATGSNSRLGGGNLTFSPAMQDNPSAVSVTVDDGFDASEGEYIRVKLEASAGGIYALQYWYFHVITAATGGVGGNPGEANPGGEPQSVEEPAEPEWADDAPYIDPDPSQLSIDNYSMYQIHHDDADSQWALRINRRDSDGAVDFGKTCREEPPSNGAKGLQTAEVFFLSACALGISEIAIHPRGEPDNIVRGYSVEIYDPDAPVCTPKPAYDLTLTPGNGSLTANWSPALCAPNGYLVRWRERSPGSSLSHGITVTGSTWTIPYLTNGVEYIVRIDTKNTANNGVQKGAALAERGTPSP